MKTPKPKKEKPQTFGRIVSETEIKRHYGMVYSITIGKQIYIGQKCFYKKGQYCDDWKYYASSSRQAKAMVKSRGDAVFKILEFVDTSKSALLSVESRYIKQTWIMLDRLGHINLSLNYAIGKTTRTQILKQIRKGM